MKDQTITFAAMCQVAYLVQQISRKGFSEELEQESDNMTILLQSITETSPETTLDVYGGHLVNIKKGLESVIDSGPFYYLNKVIF